MSNSVWPHRQQPTRLPRPWDSPGKNTGEGCHFLLQCRKVKSESEVAQSCLTCSPWDSPGKSTGVGCHCLLRLGFLSTYKIPVGSGKDGSHHADNPEYKSRHIAVFNPVRRLDIQSRMLAFCPSWVGMIINNIMIGRWGHLPRGHSEHACKPLPDHCHFYTHVS